MKRYAPHCWRELAFMGAMTALLLFNLTFFDIVPFQGDETGTTGAASLVSR
ncbi:hypothetical protein [Pseudodesulfovibrio sp. zrk46]|uniref:hypothetical protein n=1 Tax=Pseudodesulfovibrio sp. zrk46 TaxID=2725288 RepID=UPI001448ABE3|nr:hypothetical protein [Pseudodesulfovibrio sp. zrk46]QJB55238.1 hypothetical protein HFN16_01950 [Pseudodesulfovibrio sp. zrk46]